MPLSDATQQLQDNPTITRAIPGASLTANPGQFPYERPPATSRPDRAFLALKREIYKNRDDVVELIRSGLSCETVASSLVMNAFTQGMCSPDVAEIIKEPLTVEIFKMVDNFGLRNVKITNEKQSKSVLPEHTENFSQDMNSEVTMDDSMFTVGEPVEAQNQGFMDMPSEPSQEELV